MAPYGTALQQCSSLATCAGVRSVVVRGRRFRGTVGSVSDAVLRDGRIMRVDILLSVASNDVVALGHLWREEGSLPLHAGSERVRRSFNRHNWVAVDRGDAVAVLAVELASPVLVQQMAWGLKVAAFHGNYTACVSMDAYKKAHRGFVGPACSLCTDPPCGTPSPPTTARGLRAPSGTAGTGT
eukprot:gene5499-10289_t